MLTTIKIRRKPGDRRTGLLAAGGRVLRCALGRAGPSAFKREGDGATPAGTALRPLWGYWRPDRGSRPASALALSPIAVDDGWCDAPGHPAYNGPVRLPFAASHERLWRKDRLYDICVVLDWNMAPRGRARHRGSAIFMHLARPGIAPTEGCIALGRRDLEWLLARIGPRTRLFVQP